MKKISIIIGIGVILLCMIFSICGFFLVKLFIPFMEDLTSSVDDQGNGISFYESTGGWDYSRIGLFEPYQLVGDEDSWQIQTISDKTSIWGGANNIKYIYVKNGVIYAYAIDSLYEGDSYEDLWYVIIPEENFEKGFTTEEEFLNYLSERGIDDPQMRDVNELYDELLDKGYLEWYPEEVKD